MNPELLDFDDLSAGVPFQDLPVSDVSWAPGGTSWGGIPGWETGNVLGGALRLGMRRAPLIRPKIRPPARPPGAGRPPTGGTGAPRPPGGVLRSFRNARGETIHLRRDGRFVDAANRPYNGDLTDDLGVTATMRDGVIVQKRYPDGRVVTRPPGNGGGGGQGGPALPPGGGGRPALPPGGPARPPLPPGGTPRLLGPGKKVVDPAVPVAAPAQAPSAAPASPADVPRAARTTKADIDSAKQRHARAAPGSDERTEAFPNTAKESAGWDDVSISDAKAGIDGGWDDTLAYADHVLRTTGSGGAAAPRMPRLWLGQIKRLGADIFLHTASGLLITGVVLAWQERTQRFEPTPAENACREGLPVPCTDPQGRLPEWVEIPDPTTRDQLRRAAGRAGVAIVDGDVGRALVERSLFILSEAGHHMKALERRRVVRGALEKAFPT